MGKYYPKILVEHKDGSVTGRYENPLDRLRDWYKGTDIEEQIAKGLKLKDKFPKVKKM